MQNDFERLTGVEYLKQMIAGTLRSPMADSMNMRLIEVADGTATFEASPSEKFYNPQGRVHGGYTATLLDSAMGCAVQTKMAPGIAFGTIELKVNYVRKLVVETGRLLCTGTVLHAGRTMCTAEGKVLDEAGKLYAHGSGTFLVYPT
ncbi:MAG TPA: PaaI family thioesterase [Aestuariivirga sp.]|nr:PaaI family thioesterase [Aestuariivirga sp.]